MTPDQKIKRWVSHTDAPIGEVFKCSLEEAVSAVEEAIGRLGGTVEKTSE
jgi:hypothetical protein